jgi:hypothetical protein
MPWIILMKITRNNNDGAAPAREPESVLQGCFIDYFLSAC